jgi:imidazolonepropionase-like amidohydrolase/Tol biopolymer transport system component
MYRSPFAHVLIGAVAVGLFPQPAHTQAKKWSVEEVRGKSVPLKYTVDEGTWMSIDVSPDGRTLVFDILGDLYLLPIDGGKATRLTSGTRWDAVPRFSPDGSQILFASDPTGSDQLWTMPARGGEPKAVTTEGGYQYGPAVWDPSGNFIFALRSAFNEDAGPPGFVMYHLSGGAGKPIVSGYGHAGIAPSNDGRYLYYSTSNPRQAGGEIQRIDRRTGEKTTVVEGYDGVFRPVPSRDGKLLAFVALIDAVPTLMVRDLATGKDRTLYRRMNWVEAYSGDDLDYLPSYAFMPDDKTIVFTAEGKIRRVDVATGKASVIPFSADIDQVATSMAYFRYRIPDSALKPKVLHWVQPLAPNQLVFSATGKIFRYDVGSNRATPLGGSTGLQYAPAVSPDGKVIAYIDWVDSLGGRIVKANADGSSPVVLTRRGGRFQNISWSNDSRKLVVAEQRVRADGDGEMNYEIHWMDAAGGELNSVATIGSKGDRKTVVRPVFDRTDTRIQYVERGQRMGGMVLKSMNLDGTNRRMIAKAKLGDEMAVSPDGKWLAFTERQDVYLAALPPEAEDSIEVSATGGPFPVHRLSTEGADYLYWLDGGKTLFWSWGPRAYQIDVASVTTGSTPQPRVTSINFEVPRAQPKGNLLLKNARIVTMKGDEVIEKGDILIANNRIAAVGRAGLVKAPTGATSIDLSGKTIIPGFIDLHAHYGPGNGPQQGPDVYAQQDPELVANLAYGVTTWRDPSIRSQTLFSLAEMVEAGTTLGPRLFGTGDIFFISEWVCCGQPRDFEDAKRIVRHQKALGATYIKEHTDPRRDQVQWIIEAAREESVMVAVDPARGPRRELRPLVDGAASLEHLYAAGPVKKDVIEMLARLGSFYVPTLVIAGLESYYLTTMNAHDDPKLRRFVPHLRIEGELRYQNRWLLPHQIPKWYGESIRDIVRGGGKVAMGSHGQVQGLGAHWEIWAMAMGGLTGLEAIRTATLVAAETLGLQDDLGSLEKGKLADLIVLDKNPLTDIKNTNTIRYVMKNGVLWNGDSMDEIWPTKRKRPRARWEEH